MTISIDPIFRTIGAALSQHGLGWAVAGGWAIDLFLGRLTRSHADADIAVWRDEQLQLRSALPDWDFQIAVAGRLQPWLPAALVEAPLHELHARGPSGDTAECLLNDREGDDWVYRREPRIRLSVDRAILVQGDLKFLAPEVVLLYKSKIPRPIDDADFQSVSRRLDVDSRRWLRLAIAQANPEHSWIQRLEDREA